MAAIEKKNTSHPIRAQITIAISRILLEINEQMQKKKETVGQHRDNPN